jgi:hypothetical protein
MGLRGAHALGRSRRRRRPGPACCSQPHPVTARLAILYDDWHAVKRLLGKAKGICEAGGDWEHKNKLKVGGIWVQGVQRRRRWRWSRGSSGLCSGASCRARLAPTPFTPTPHPPPQVYEAVFSMYTRDFKRAASLFLDSIATFTT